MALVSLTKPVRLYVFHGPHRWAPEEGWQQALDWIALREMQRGIVPSEPAKMDAINKRFAEYAERSITDFSATDAYRARESDARDFASALTTTPAEKEALK